MGLLEQIEEDKKKLSEMQTAESENQAVVEDEEQDTDEDVEDEPEDKDEAIDDGTEEGEKEPEKKLDDSGYARLRREAAAAKKIADEREREAKELKAELERLRAPAPAKEDSIEAEPDIEKDPAAWLKWNQKRTDQQIQEIKSWKEERAQAERQSEVYTQAINGFKAYEAEFARSVPDYDDRAAFFNQKVTQGFRDLYPTASEEAIQSRVVEHVLRMAAEFASSGLNPAEELYHLASERYGYTASQEKEEGLKPDLGKVAANRRRNAGMAGAKGRGGDGDITPKVAASMTAAEFAKLPKAEKDKIYARLRQMA